MAFNTNTNFKFDTKAETKTGLTNDKFAYMYQLAMAKMSGTVVEQLRNDASLSKVPLDEGIRKLKEGYAMAAAAMQHMKTIPKHEQSILEKENAYGLYVAQFVPQIINGRRTKPRTRTAVCGRQPKVLTPREAAEQKENRRKGALQAANTRKLNKEKKLEAIRMETLLGPSPPWVRKSSHRIREKRKSSLQTRLHATMQAQRF